MKSYRYPAITILIWISLIDGVSGQQFNYNFDSLRVVIQQRPDDTASIGAYIDYAARFFYAGSDSGLYYLNKGRALAYKSNNYYRFSDCLKNQGDLCSINGDFRSAIPYYRQAMGIAEKMRYHLLLARIQGNLGIAYKNLGEMDSAMTTLDRVAATFKDNLHTHADSVALAVHYIQLFDVYRVQGLIADALYYGELGYALSKTLDFPRGIGYGLYVEALKYCKDDPRRAMGYCDSALGIAVSKKIAELEVFVRGCKADIFMDDKKYERAEKELLHVTRYTAGSIRLVTNSRLSRVYFGLGDYKKALHCYQYAIDLASSLGYRSEISTTLESGMAIYQKLGDYKMAFELLKKYDQVQQQMASEKLKISFERSSLQFKTAEKDKQLAQSRLIIEQKDNRLKRQSLIILLITLISVTVVVVSGQRIKNLEAAKKLHLLGAVMSGEERERARIAKDLHDGVGGILSVVKMRFSLSKTEFPGLQHSETFNKAMGMLDEASSEIRKTAHNLMPDMLIRLGLDEALSVFCNNIRLRGQGKICYQPVGEIGRFNKSFELTVYRMVQELISNVIKHSNAGSAYVQLTRQAAVLTVSVEDDGVGFDIESLKTVGGLGLHSVMDRVNSLGGEIEIDASTGNGVSIYFELPITPFNSKFNGINEDQGSHS